MSAVPAAAGSNRRSYDWKDPAAIPVAAADRSGMEVLTAWLAGELPAPPICPTLDFALTSVEPGQVSFTGSPAAWLYNPIGSVHGGWLATLLDSAMGCAVYSELPTRTAWSTTDINVRFIRPVTADTGPITVSGRVEHLGRRTATASARATDIRCRLVASATTACLLTPQPT